LERTNTVKRKLRNGLTSSSIDLLPSIKLRPKSFTLIARQAVISDMKILNELAARSEAYWGLDENHVNAFKRNYAIKKRREFAT